MIASLLQEDAVLRKIAKAPKDQLPRYQWSTLAANAPLVPESTPPAGLKVNIGGSEARIALYRQLNATAGFRQFLFRDLDKPVETTARAGKGGEAGGEDFDSIWSSL